MGASFNETRATQAAALLARLEGGAINYTKLIKLLYLADRKSLVDSGSTITGDRFVNMKNGPVLSRVYDCIKSPEWVPTWARALRRRGDWDLELVEDPGRDDLSDFAVAVLTELSARHRADDFGDMIKVVHNLPEWKDPGPRNQSLLSYAAVLRAAGLDDDELAAYVALPDLDQLFS